MGTTSFTIGDAGFSGVADAILGDASRLDFFTTIIGVDGGDEVNGTDGDDVIDVGAGAGDDVVPGAQGNDEINGGSGNDSISGDGTWIKVSDYAAAGGSSTTLTLNDNADDPV